MAAISILGDHGDFPDPREDLQERGVLVEHRGADRVDGAIEEGGVDDVAWQTHQEGEGCDPRDQTKPRGVNE